MVPDHKFLFVFSFCFQIFNDIDPFLDSLTLLGIIVSSDQLPGLEFDCNQETSLVRGVRPLIDF